MALKRVRIGELLLNAGLINQDQLKEALRIQKSTGDKLGSVLVQENYVSETQIMEVLEFQLGIPYIDLNNAIIAREVQKIIPYNLIRRHNVLPVKLDRNMLY